MWQKSGSLAKIARDSQVYQVRPDFIEMIKNNGAIRPRLVPISSASTSTGFCAKHDRDVFSPIENKDLVFDEEQCMLLGFRALKAEYFAKLGQQTSNSTVRQLDKGKDKATQLNIQDMANWSQEGVESGLQDFSMAASVFDKALISGDYSDLGFYVVEFDKCPSVLCSGLFSTEVDFEGNTLQNLLSKDPIDLMTLSVVATKNGGAAVFSWAKSALAANDKFIASFDNIEDSRKPDALVRICFELLDNIYLEPDWWEGLGSEESAALTARIKSGMLTGPDLDLTEDGLCAANWNVISLKSCLA